MSQRTAAFLWLSRRRSTAYSMPWGTRAAIDAASRFGLWWLHPACNQAGALHVEQPNALTELLSVRVFVLSSGDSSALFVQEPRRRRVGPRA
jgi:hypothetical protein